MQQKRDFLASDLLEPTGHSPLPIFESLEKNLQGQGILLPRTDLSLLPISEPEDDCTLLHFNSWRNPSLAASILVFSFHGHFISLTHFIIILFSITADIMVDSFHLQPFSLHHIKISNLPYNAALAHAPSSKGQSWSNNHWRISKLSLATAWMNVNSFYKHPFSLTHFNISKWPPTAVFS